MLFYWFHHAAPARRFSFFPAPARRLVSSMERRNPTLFHVNELSSGLWHLVFLEPDHDQARFINCLFSPASHLVLVAEDRSGGSAFGSGSFFQNLAALPVPPVQLDAHHLPLFVQQAEQMMASAARRPFSNKKRARPLM